MTWWMWIGAGVGWVAFVGMMIVLSLAGIDETVEAGLAENPNDARVVIAVASSLIFAIPGFAFIVVGLKRRKGALGV
jgi:fumarate reductase subunit D